jgi:hypothetical protein
MILINKNQANVIALTLTEKVSLSNPYFLFEFNNDQSKASSFFIASDISSQQARYNKFSITEKNSPNALAGEVSLAPGFYHYTIREQASSTNLNPASSGAIVETGKVKVIDPAAASNTAYQSTDSNVVYQG